jgi:hypothetical protein
LLLSSPFGYGQDIPDTVDESKGDSAVIDRRRDQVTTEPGYIASPIAVNIPGLGFSYGVTGSAFNLFSTEMDIFGFTANGDTNGYGVGIVDTPIWKENLVYNVFYSNFRDSGLELHRRGIGSDPDERRIFTFRRSSVLVHQLSLRLWEKRVQFALGSIKRVSVPDKILDKSGDEIARLDSEEDINASRFYGAILDLTDDRADPRRGFALEVQRFDPPIDDGFSADFYIVDYNATAYIPIGAASTWAFNYFRSDSVVASEGELDRETIKQKQGLNCDFITSPTQRTSCLDEQNQRIDETLAAHRNGTSSGLGGTQRLRSYVSGRYSSAHAVMYGTEFRWNLTEEFTPFNIYLAKGIRTGIQLAFFGEWGTVAEHTSDLNKHFRKSVGAGVRLLIASGFIARLDMAYGDEGWQPVLFFNYPWFVF